MTVITNTLHQPDERSVQSNFHTRAKELLKHYNSANILSSITPLTFLFTLDKNQCEYFYLSGTLKNIEAISNNALNHHHVSQYWHEEDIKILMEKILPDIETLCRQNNDANNIYSFSFNLRMRSNADSWLIFIQSITIINAVCNNEPLHFIGTLTDITHFKSDNRINFIVEKNNKEKSTYDLIKHLLFFPGEKNAVHLTKRELEILKCLNDGLSSKQIADKLFASLNTINNHRKNILKKTRTKNTSELIGFALKKGLIV